MKKSVKGFTLIELIVVIAIIGILTAILVPAMMSYVKKAKYSRANANAREIYDALMSSAADMYSTQGITGGFPDQVFSKLYLVDVYNALPDSQKAQMSIDLEGYFGVAYDSDGFPARVAWGKTNSADEVVGRYPEPTSVDKPGNWSNWNN